jgi:signal recognition particle subunit SRP54
MNAGRRRRIANGSGTSVQDVNRLLKGYEDSRKMMRQMMGAGGATKKKKGKVRRKGSFFPF